ncbi:sensor histidine kinase [Rivibacter subsaxonicus]|uniref:histidine kinase n=1 Tax=Rivibacter subsaxonicus TaxID=457575 RepID=A0A4Q7VGB4_9BURK|nr:ATP-binding protein [Rivibacter subsaxonicus]RZT95066.1 two-component system sensor histidine kinase PilS (NtrC family) [Rivibacter subsaxonicus]
MNTSTSRAQGTESTWFGTIDGVTDDDGSSRLDRGEWRASDAPDSRFLSRQARRIAASGPSAFVRLYRVFINARALLGVVLLGAVLLISALAPSAQTSLVFLCAVYAGVALAVALFPRWLGAPVGNRLGRRQWLGTIGVDVAAFGLLHLLSADFGLNGAALLVMPVLMAGVLTPRVHALGLAAAVALLLLVQSLASLAAGEEPYLKLTQAGLAGAGLFLVTVLANELAGRLAREELTARGSLELARQQARLNRLVLEEMQEGVLVVDRRTRLRAANPAARALLGVSGPIGESSTLDAKAGWQPLAQAVGQAYAQRDWPADGRDITLTTPDGHPRHLHTRLRFTQGQAGGSELALEDYAVLFIEDLRTVQARVRQEKLAAMGRVSAGIAHEIRNPLTAIMQANALLAEDIELPAQRLLVRMVDDNAQRLKRIVDDVLEVAPGETSAPAPLDASAFVAAACSEWARTAQLQLGEGSPLRVDLPAEALGVEFDADHLRRVLVNLLDNALRHGTSQPGAVWVRLAGDGDGLVRLLVASDGAPIPPEVERHLFEPFFSSRSRGTGLGLYICRELCERYGASIEYQQRPGTSRHRNAFWVTMRRVTLPSPEPRLHA